MYAGIFSRVSNRPPSDFATGEALLALLDPFSHSEKGDWEQDGSLLLAATLRRNTPESKGEESIFRCPETGRLIVSWARLDNRGELFELLGTPGSEQSRITDQQLLIDAHARFGEACVERVVGDFSFVVLDPVREVLFAARDPLGVKPFFYHLSDSVFVFSTSPAVFTRLEHPRFTADPAWMARYLTGVSKSHTATAFEGVVKLAPGHSLVVEPERHAVRRYFAFRNDAPFAATRNVKWVEEYRTVLEEANRCRLRSAYPIGTETSGGIDSSTVTAFAAKLIDPPLERLHTFGFAGCELEPRHILETSHRWGIHRNHIFTNGEGIESRKDEIDRALKVLGYPEEHGTATGHAPFYELCSQFGIRTLLSGFGGDEAVTNPAGHLRQEMVLRRSLQGLWQAVPGNCLTRPLRMIKDVRSLGIRSEFNPRFHKAFSARWPYNLVREEVSRSLGLEHAFMEQARYDAPYRTINEFVLENRINAPFVPTRLENCTLVAASYGVEYRWPLLDPRLIQQYLSTPAIEKAKGEVGRYLHRRAVDGLVPAEVLWKGKDMGLPRHRLERSWDESQKARTIQKARELEGNLHGQLLELVDIDKLRKQIAQAPQGGTEPFWFQFRRNVRCLEWLNIWLHGLK